MDRISEQIVAPALYVVATPIGNLADITLRALHILQGVDQIAAEDTRHSGKLLSHFDIQTPMLSLHEHNEQERTVEILAALQRGASIALISDAGTPLISDPGYGLVTAVALAGHRIIPLPGACAAVTALSVAGLPTDTFTFAGFSPGKRGARKEFFQRFGGQSETFIYYESPKRLLAGLEQLVEVVGSDRQLVVARELTKMHEVLLRGSAGELLGRLQSDPGQCRGEIVVLVAGVSRLQRSELDTDAERLLALLIDELPITRAAQIVARYRKLPKRQVYQRALALQE